MHDYLNRDEPTRAALSESGARVFVYVGQSLIRRYEVPRGVGTLWTVFSVDGLGELHDVNTLTGAAPDPSEALFRVLAAPVGVVSAETPPVEAPRLVSDDASTLNADGERAYHAGRVEESIERYKEAIERAPTFAQAWSNLGLSYRKLGRSSEALWANRQSIAFASGGDANVVRASSYYNIARIYEAEGQFADALVQYERANRERPMKVYTDAQRRMAMKLGR